MVMYIRVQIYDRCMGSGQRSFFLLVSSWEYEKPRSAGKLSLIIRRKKCNQSLFAFTESVACVARRSSQSRREKRAAKPRKRVFPRGSLRSPTRFRGFAARFSLLDWLERRAMQATESADSDIFRGWTWNNVSRYFRICLRKW